MTMESQRMYFTLYSESYIHDTHSQSFISIMVYVTVLIIKWQIVFV